MPSCSRRLSETKAIACYQAGGQSGERDDGDTSIGMGATCSVRVTAFKWDAPLHSQFPITLKNGKSIPGVHVICNTCGSQLSGDRVRGRVVRSMPHVVTIEANGLCEPCDRLTQIHCRLRAGEDRTLIEWLGSDGRWHVRDYRQPTLAEKITKQICHLLSQ